MSFWGYSMPLDELQIKKSDKEIEKYLENNYNIFLTLLNQNNALNDFTTFVNTYYTTDIDIQKYQFSKLSVDQQNEIKKNVDKLSKEYEEFIASLHKEKSTTDKLRDFEISGFNFGNSLMIEHGKILGIYGITPTISFSKAIPVKNLSLKIIDIVKKLPKILVENKWYSTVFIFSSLFKLGCSIYELSYNTDIIKRLNEKFNYKYVTNIENDVEKLKAKLNKLSYRQKTTKDNPVESGFYIDLKQIIVETDTLIQKIKTKINEINMEIEKLGETRTKSIIQSVMNMVLGAGNFATIILTGGLALPLILLNSASVTTNIFSGILTSINAEKCRQEINRLKEN